MQKKKDYNPEPDPDEEGGGTQPQQQEQQASGHPTAEQLHGECYLTLRMDRFRACHTLSLSLTFFLVSQHRFNRRDCSTAGKLKKVSTCMCLLSLSLSYTIAHAALLQRFAACQPGKAIDRSVSIRVCNFICSNILCRRAHSIKNCSL